MNNNTKYVMGVDSYDAGSSAICVFSKESNTVVYSKRFADDKEFNKEIKRVATYYGIPEDNILRETSTPKTERGNIEIKDSKAVWVPNVNGPLKMLKP